MTPRRRDDYRGPEARHCRALLCLPLTKLNWQRSLPYLRVARLTGAARACMRGGHQTKTNFPNAGFKVG